MVVRALWRRARARLRVGPAFRWRYSGRTPERLLIAPPDLRLADPQIASEIYYGRFPLSGHLVQTSGQSPFSIGGTLVRKSSRVRMSSGDTLARVQRSR